MSRSLRAGVAIGAVALIAIVAISLGGIGAAETDVSINETEITIDNDSIAVDVDVEATGDLANETDVTVEVLDDDEDLENATLVNTSSVTLEDANETATISVGIEEHIENETTIDGNETWTVETLANGDDGEVEVVAVEVDDGTFAIPIVGTYGTEATVLGAIVLVGLLAVLWKRREP